jgi:arginase
MNVQLLVVPYDSGLRDARLGAGPARLLAAGLESHLRQAGHAVESRLVALSPGRWLPEIGAAFDLARTIARETAAARRRGAFPMVLAGNCITALGTVAGLSPDATAVLWFDAHGDFNTPETSAGGFLDGMALATLAGRCWTELARSIPGFAPVPEEAVCLLGARDLDALEAKALAASAVRHLPPRDVPGGLPLWLAALRPTAQAYVHLDLDVLDPSEARVNQYSVPGGLATAELEAAISAIGRRLPIAGAALTAYDPEQDHEGKVPGAAFRLVDSVLSAAGRASRGV